MGGELLDKKETKEKQQNAETNDSSNNCSTKKRKRKEVAIFGNYRSYYGYRIGEDFEEDPRLKVMKKEWFEGKDCLDIGCNSGIITISIAEKFCCQSILGVDIDGARVEDANWTLRKIVNKRSRKMLPATAKPVMEEKVHGPENNVTVLQSDLQRVNTDNSSLERNLFDVVSFQKGNFVHSWHPPRIRFIMQFFGSLSVTKWIHLNWGDDGIINLFSKVWRLLQPGGVFIVEPQPWISYYKNRQVSETASSNYQNIQIGPEDFQDILLDKVGFRMVENITSSLSGSKTGFDRPILAFWK